MSPTRQLAAIMFTDIAGYTGLMHEDEGYTLTLLEKKRRKLEEEVARHNGRILEFRGDGSLCSFSSTLECVRAAIAIQQAMLKDPIVPTRIGIHSGDIMIAGEAIYGDGVNIASRMESLAVPGSIFISERVYEDIKNQKDIQAIYLGRYRLKNVREEIELFAISNPGIVIPESYDPEGKGDKVDQKSILVLPFVNMSNDVSQEYFSDGLTEELISSLSRLKDIRVISRTTSMEYKKTIKNIRTISKETGASYIMEGSVRTHGNSLRITAQFVDAIDDVHLWAETYRGTLDDVFDIQEKVASNIVDALLIHLTEEEKNSLQKRRTEDTEAYQLYLQGRFFWNKRNESGLMTAVRFFERSIQKDPNYALAWAGLADAYNLLGEFTNQSRLELYPKARSAANKALELDDQLAEAHISLGCILMLYERKWKEAEKEFLIGIELNPNYPTARHWYTECLLFTGRVEKALEEINVAFELDPVSPAIIRDQGMTYYYARQYDKAIEKSKNALDLNPDFIAVHRLLSLAYLEKGFFDKAIAENQLWGILTGNEVKSKVALAHIYAVMGKTSDAISLLNEIQTKLVLGENDYRGMALVYTALGDRNGAFWWLEKSLERNEPSISSLIVDPKLDPIRDDPRFEKLVRKVGLLDETSRIQPAFK